MQKSKIKVVESPLAMFFKTDREAAQQFCILHFES
jgi:hypothetical protein